MTQYPGLGEYIEEIRARHLRLSVNRMATESNVPESVLRGIIKYGKRAMPETLKAITDKWGTDEDYIKLMRLAGHPLPEEMGGQGELTVEQRQLLKGWEKLSADEQAAIAWLLDPNARRADRGPMITTINAMRKIGVGGQIKVASEVVKLVLEAQGSEQDDQGRKN